MKISRIPELIKDINIHINILNELENKKETNSKEINDLKDEIRMLQEELFSKLSFPISIETMNSESFTKDIEEIVEQTNKINKLNENHNTSDYSLIQDAYLNLELMAENIIFKYSKSLT